MKIIREEQFLSEMARVCFLPSNDLKGVEVYIRTDDKGNIPHMHIRKYESLKNTYKVEWETCVKFTSAKYFMHGPYKDRLPRGYGDLLNKTLKSENKKDPGRTYWQSAIVAWNNNNSSVELPIDLEQPDYSRI